LSAIIAAFWLAPAGRYESAASRRRLCDLRTRSEQSACTCCGIHVTSVQQHMLHAHVALLNRSLRADADYATSKCDAKRARRADADYATSERDAKRARRADADQKNAPTQSILCDLQTRFEESAASRRGPKKCSNPKRTMRPPNEIRPRRANADYVTTERDAKRARLADTD
jgi:hypothetical protein